MTKTARPTERAKRPFLQAVAIASAPLILAVYLAALDAFTLHIAGLVSPWARALVLATALPFGGLLGFSAFRTARAILRAQD